MSLQDQEGWKNQERAYEQGLNVGKKFAQNKVLKLLDEVIAEFESQKPENSDFTCDNWQQWEAEVSAVKYTKSLIQEQIT